MVAQDGTSAGLASQRLAGRATHNAALEVVSGATQEDLLLDDLLLGRHLFPFGVVTGGEVEEGDGAVKHLILGKRRASCGGSNEG